MTNETLRRWMALHRVAVERFARRYGRDEDFRDTLVQEAWWRVSKLREDAGERAVLEAARKGAAAAYAREYRDRQFRVRTVAWSTGLDILEDPRGDVFFKIFGEECD